MNSKGNVAKTRVELLSNCLYFFHVLSSIFGRDAVVQVFEFISGTDPNSEKFVVKWLFETFKEIEDLRPIKENEEYDIDEEESVKEFYIRLMQARKLFLKKFEEKFFNFKEH